MIELGTCGDFWEGAGNVFHGKVGGIWFLVFVFIRCAKSKVKAGWISWSLWPTAVVSNIEIYLNM